MTYPLPVGPLLPGSVTDDGNQKFIQVRIYSRFKNNDLKYTALGREPVSIVHYTMPGCTILISSLIRIEGEVYTYLPYLRVEI